MQASLVLAAPVAPVAPVAPAPAAPPTIEAAALAELTDVPPVGPNVRDFFGALARWQPGQGNGTHIAEAPEQLATMPAAVDEAAVGGAPEGYDLRVFAGAAIADADEHAARVMAGLYPESPDAGNGEGHAATMAGAVAELAEPLPGNPARPASSELSLDQVFTGPANSQAPERPSRRSSASFSFDQFFSQAPGDTPPRAGTPAAPMTPVAPAAQTPEEIEQFQSWLGGLKKK